MVNTMALEYWLQYLAMLLFAVVIIVLLLRKNNLKKYIPVGMFVILYGDFWCFLADHFKLWSYPTRIFPNFTVASIPFNYVALPTLVILWLMYCPRGLNRKILWAAAGSAFFIGLEYIFTRYTKALEYKNGFDIHITFVLWLVSWYIFYKFHLWINNEL